MPSCPWKVHHLEPRSEADVPPDHGVARSRATGGVASPHARDTHSTTGTTPSETFVGRVAGDDTGSEEETGADARARQIRQIRQTRRQERQRRAEQEDPPQ